MLRRHISLPALDFVGSLLGLGTRLWKQGTRRPVFLVRLLRPNRRVSFDRMQEAFNCIYFTYLFLTQSYTVLSKNCEGPQRQRGHAGRKSKQADSRTEASFLHARWARQTGECRFYCSWVISSCMAGKQWALYSWFVHLFLRASGPLFLVSGCCVSGRLEQRGKWVDGSSRKSAGMDEQMVQWNRTYPSEALEYP